MTDVWRVISVVGQERDGVQSGEMTVGVWPTGTTPLVDDPDWTHKSKPGVFSAARVATFVTESMTLYAEELVNRVKRQAAAERVEAAFADAVAAQGGGD